MKIEKVSDTQIRVTLNHADLKTRDIKIGELAYGSSKAQALFKDMMHKAYEDFGFETENVPLMIEAVPLSTDSIMIVVTKVEDPSQIDEKLDTIGERPTHRTFKDPVADRLADLELLSKSEEKPSSPKAKESDTLLYVFNNFDDICHVAHHIKPLYFGDSSLYKYADKYFMLLGKNERKNTKISILVSLLGEFGQRGQSSELSELFLKEHGKLMIDGEAIDILSQYL
ncbi:MAG: adaptor protein MecA [Cellulosilyticaceae bacterium]